MVLENLPSDLIGEIIKILMELDISSVIRLRQVSKTMFDRIRHQHIFDVWMRWEPRLRIADIKPNGRVSSLFVRQNGRLYKMRLDLYSDAIEVPFGCDLDQSYEIMKCTLIPTVRPTVFLDYHGQQTVQYSFINARKYVKATPDDITSVLGIKLAGTSGHCKSAAIKKYISDHNISTDKILYVLFARQAGISAQKW